MRSRPPNFSAPMHRNFNSSGNSILRPGEFVLFVVDSSSLLAVSKLRGPQESKIAEVFDALFALAKKGKLGFPASVPNACRAFDDSNFAGAWASPTHASFKTQSVPYSFQSDVLAQCPRLLDEGSEDDDQSQVELVAYAMYFHSRGHAVTVITEDTQDNPFRASTAFAATAIGMQTLTMSQFMLDRGL